MPMPKRESKNFNKPRIFHFEIDCLIYRKLVRSQARRQFVEEMENAFAPKKKTL
jgi:hypothetical protein